jgi:hypothetical protein
MSKARKESFHGRVTEFGVARNCRPHHPLTEMLCIYAPATERKVSTGHNRTRLTPDSLAKNSHPALPATIEDALPDTAISGQNVLAKTTQLWHHVCSMLDESGQESEIRESE